MAIYLTSEEFLALAGGADRVQQIASADHLETYLETVLAGAESRLNSGISRAGYSVPIDLEAVAEDLRDGSRSMLGQYVAGLAAQTIGGPDHLLPIGKEAMEWLKALQARTVGIAGVDRPEGSITRRPRAFKVVTGERNIPAELFSGMARIGGAR
jgi:hypothetical protein